MDIQVGRVEPIQDRTESRRDGHQWVAAELLATRSPRRKRKGKSPEGGQRRKSKTSNDPANGRVLLLMVPDRQQLPVDLDRGGYRVLLRFVKS